MKKIILSGIQPTGRLMLGNYLGAIKNWTKLQDEYECLYMIVDMHSLTVQQNPIEKKERIIDSLALYIACGLDPKKNIIFFQSHVHEHAELAWVLNCHAYMGELSRMTQFKEKSEKHNQNINAGLFTYPALMAADILLYQADLVPVGEDQKQHLEITRDIALRFNSTYGKTFTVPEVHIPEVGARIMSLQEPMKKMSKSDDNDNNLIMLLDSPDVIMKKFKKSVTDSDGKVTFNKETKPGISNLMSILSSMTGMSLSQIESDFEGKGYGDFKIAVATAVIDCLKPIQDKFCELKNNKDYLEEVYKSGAMRAQEKAEITIRKVYDKVGFILKDS